MICDHAAQTHGAVTHNGHFRPWTNLRSDGRVMTGSHHI
jgi:hypothetical protein